MSTATEFYRHGLQRMAGRGLSEKHRAATPLELLFDLTFVAAFGVAGSQLAHGIAEHHVGPAVIAFSFSMVALVLAWINYSWFASAFDTDDWLFRVLTMVQMAGVIVLAIGLPQIFTTVEQGGDIANEVMVSGYVVMRVAMIAQWLRAAYTTPQYRAVALTYVTLLAIAQTAWVVLIIIPVNSLTFLIGALIASAIDWSAPIIAERKGQRVGAATPWHAHHIAERYSLLAIIALGETVIGTLAAAQAISAAEGWTFAAIVVIALGVVLSFALWWVYFMLPSGPVIDVRRGKGFGWGYGHIFVFGSIAAVGAGLHVIGYLYDDHYHLDTVTVIAAIAIPVTLLIVSLLALHAWLVSAAPANMPAAIVAALLPVGAIVLATLGFPIWLCLLVVVLAPVFLVVTYELGGWRALQAQLTRVVGS